MASYANRLKALHADLNLFNHLKFYIRDLLQFEVDGDAQRRLLQEPANFHMNSVYFTPKQVYILISFKGRDGRTLEEALQAHIARKIMRTHRDCSSRHEICNVHDLVPVLQNLFGVKKDFDADFGFKCLFNKFATKRLD